MWFKQVQIYQYTNTIDYDADKLEKALDSLTFKPCLPSFNSSHGWASPLDKEDAPLVHAGNGFLMICMQMEQKILPQSVVKQALDEKIKEIKALQDRKVSQKEKNTLKDEIISTLLPRAFCKPSRVYAFFDLKHQRMLVNTTTASKLEIFLKLIKRTLPEQNFKILESKRIHKLMTNWLLGDKPPENLTLAQSCVLRDPLQQNRKIRCQHQELNAQGILLFIKDGCEAQQVALSWRDQVSFLLTEQMHLRTIKYHETVLEQADLDTLESEEQKFDTDFVIMTTTLSELVDDLIKTCSATTKEKRQEVAVAI